MFTVAVSHVNKSGEEGTLGLVAEEFYGWGQIRWWLTGMIARQMPHHLRENYDKQQIGDWAVRKMGRLHSIGLTFPATERYRVTVVNNHQKSVEYYQLGEIVTSQALLEFVRQGGLNDATPEGLRCVRLAAGMSLFDGIGNPLNANEGDEEYENNRPLPQVPAGRAEMRPLTRPPSDQDYSDFESDILNSLQLVDELTREEKEETDFLESCSLPPICLDRVESYDSDDPPPVSAPVLRRGVSMLGAK